MQFLFSLGLNIPDTGFFPFPQEAALFCHQIANVKVIAFNNCSETKTVLSDFRNIKPNLADSAPLKALVPTKEQSCSFFFST